MAKNESKDKRINDIINAAIIEFSEKSYNEVSVDAIAKRAGVSKGGLYHYFANKEVLLMETNKKMSEPIIRMIEEAIYSKNKLDGLSLYIKKYLKYWANHPREMSFFFLSMAKAFESNILREYYKDYINQSKAFFVDMLEKAVDLGEIVIDDPEAMGIMLMGALDGILSYILVNPEENIDLLAERIEKIWFANSRRQESEQ